jgi:hypothetical protein
MAQIAMQQQMNEISDYLARIDEKLDDVLRALKNRVLARMDGVDLAIREAMILRETVGRVSEITWSRVQHQSATILETQAYALRQLKDLADKIEQKTRVGDLARTVGEAEVKVVEWLDVLARCFQLHDAIGVLELDRVLDASPDELDRHRLGLKTARRDRLELLARSTEHLLFRMNAAVGTANSKVLLHPTRSPAVVQSGNRVATDVNDFRALLGIESGRDSSEARRWKAAAAEQWDKARATGARAIDDVKRFGSETRGQARSVKDKLADTIAERKLRRREAEEVRTNRIGVMTSTNRMTTDTIDITFDFRSDTPAGKDPDTYSPTLLRYHQLLWSKPLPGGPPFQLDITTPPPMYLHHHSRLGEFWLASDTVIPTFTGWSRLKYITEQIPEAENEAFGTIGYTIGGMIVFPGNQVDRKPTPNGARGLHPKIRDRFDLTVECIRRYYLGQQPNPLGDCLARYPDFFRLFGDFAGYVEFFLLQDLVDETTSTVKFFMPFEDFTRSPLPPTLDAYLGYRQRAIEFIELRNLRIAACMRAGSLTDPPVGP